MGLGYIGGVIGSVYITKKLFKARVSNNKIYYFTLLSLIVGAFPAIFFGTVVGGNMGGAYAAHITELLGYGSVGAPVGIAIGVFLVISLVMLFCAFAGYFVGQTFYKLYLYAKAT